MISAQSSDSPLGAIRIFFAGFPRVERMKKPITLIVDRFKKEEKTFFFVIERVRGASAVRDTWDERWKFYSLELVFYFIFFFLRKAAPETVDSYIEKKLLIFSMHADHFNNSTPIRTSGSRRATLAAPLDPQRSSLSGVFFFNIAYFFPPAADRSMKLKLGRTERAFCVVVGRFGVPGESQLERLIPHFFRVEIRLRERERER